MPVHHNSPNLWQDYLDAFDYFKNAAIRPGCHPRILEHTDKTDKAIVLIHGLSDSPYFMTAIGDYFHTELGYNVYIPLLQCHGLEDPQGMETVELEEWENNACYAIGAANRKAERISIGGLSTGGALSLYLANTNLQTINWGAVYLFSAALDLAGGPLGLVGELKEILLKTFLADLLDSKASLIGDNPYRYNRVDLDGATELARLIKRIDTMLKQYDNAGKNFPLSIFAAHSEADTTAHIAGIEYLEKIGSAGVFHFLPFKKQLGVKHASVVLRDPIEGIEKAEAANPRFADMMEAIKQFESLI